jgi:hypothetical protein
MSFVGGIKTAVRSAACTLFTGYDKINRLGAGIIYPDDVDRILPLTPGGKIANNGMALFCDRPPEPLPPGKCATQYRVDWTYNQVRPDGTVFTAPNTSTNGYTGPITNFVVDNRTNGYSIKLTDANGINWVITDDISDTRKPYATDVVLVRLDGLPDNCGVYEPTTPLPPGDRTINIDINGGNGPITFGFPILNINGDLSLPFNFDVGGVELSGDINLNGGDIELNFGGQPTDPNAPIVPTPDGPVPPAPMDDPDEDKPANIIGVIVVSTRINDVTATEIPQTTMPDIYAPRIADVSFKIRIKNKSHWTSDLPVKSRNAYIACPGDIDAIDVAIARRKGWSTVITPVRGFVPSNQVELV